MYLTKHSETKNKQIRKNNKALRTIGKIRFQIRHTVKLQSTGIHPIFPFFRNKNQVDTMP